ncbi:acyl-CoA dehydrogenase [Novosphingobium marinum]|uniref:Acyl-CoA dehydrogenase n=1 Tax=Novosphingobium marinum TaxID=1514948 RepID=A0A7Y9XV20_9SPHN|nr:acyl-CoA dehydrogenase family protein [Novosphingobium marinum]NYH93773.1 hypothetical protein [Novosphingobium marinum]GGC17185.1 acyl-CoA dehydrogenase [Novosphingobium marinum]
MNLEYTEDQVLFRDGAERFLSAEYGAGARARSTGAEDGVDPANRSAFAELGLFALTVPERLGGLGFGPLELAMVLECCGRHRVVEPIAETAIAARALATAFDAPAAQRWLPPILSGEIHATVALLSNADIAEAGDADIVSGAVPLTRGAPGAGLVVLLADTGEGERRAFAVTPGTEGVSVSAKRLLDESRGAMLTLERARIPSENGSLAADSVDQLLDELTLASCWKALGAMRAASGQTARYVQEREQFGRPLARFQAVEHMIAAQSVACEEAEAAALLAALSMDLGPSSRIRAVSAAKNKIGRASDVVAKNAVQAHGGMGVCDELPIAGYFRDLAAFRAMDGSARHLDRYERDVLGSGCFRESAILGTDAP